MRINVSLNIAILGGSSHIARAITPYLLESGAEVTLFARNPGKLAASHCRVIGDFAELMNGKYDLLINCIGAGTPKELAGDYNRWFTVLEKFDNLALEYLQKVNRQTLYVMFSSGAVYGRKNLAPAEENSVWELSPNKIAVPDYYALAKIYSEAKHRSLPDLRIADLRIFSFFSRHIELDSGYFMTDLVTAILEDKELTTSPGEMLRDYPHPADLSDLIIRCAGEEKINRAIDVASMKPLSKSDILKLFSEKFSLRYKVADNPHPASPNGEANIYLPTTEMAEKAVAWLPEFTSAETLVSETQAILSKYGKA